MPIQTDSLNRKLYDLLDTRGYNPVSKDSDVNNAGKTVPPEEADVFKFTFTKNGEEIDDCWVTVDKAQNLIVYYDQDVMKNADQSTSGSQFNDSWFGLLNHLKKWAHSRQLSFKLEPKEKLDSDMAQRTYMKKKEQIAENKKLNELSIGKKMAAYSAAQDPEADYAYGDKVIDQADRIRAKIVKKHGEKMGQHADAKADADHWGRRDASGAHKGYPGQGDRLSKSMRGKPGDYRVTKGGKMHGSDVNALKSRIKSAAHRPAPKPNLPEQIEEGYYPMGKQASYSDAVPTVKIVLQHTRQIQEGEQRFRNVARIFLENTQGERILCPFNRPGMAQIYARHLAEGGKPNDERWNHIGSLCEEYTKMAGFARAVKNGQFNESAQKLVEAGVNHFLSLRESLGKMRGHRGYNAYFESWTPTLMETEGDEPTSINELFVQETLDPRIESVMPILSKLNKNLGEMKEIDELAEWADKLIEGDGGQEALNPIGIPESEDVNEGHMSNVDVIMQELGSGVRDIYDTMNHPKTPDEKYVSNILQDMYNDISSDSGLHPDDQFEEIIDIMGDRIANEYPSDDLAEGDEMDDAEKAHLKPQIPAYMRKAKGGDWKTTAQDLEKAKVRNLSGAEGLAALKRRAGIDQDVSEDKGKIVVVNPETQQDMLDWLESEGFDAPEPTTDDNGNLVYDFKDMDHGAYIYAKDYDIGSEEADDDLSEQAKWRQGYRASGHPSGFKHKSGEVGPLGGTWDTVRDYDDDKKVPVQRHRDEIDPLANRDMAGTSTTGNPLLPKNKQKNLKGMISRSAGKHGPVGHLPEGVAEDLDADQKRVGQLGPTEKVKNNNIGKLVGANESVNLSEMDKSQPSSDRGGESSGYPYAKGGKATPVKAKDAAKDAEKALNKSMDKAHKKDVKEGSGSKEKQHSKYVDRNSPESKAKVQAAKDKMEKDKAAEPGKKLADKIDKKDVKEGQEDLDAILRIIKR
jgi:hypothetical protein